MTRYCLKISTFLLAFLLAAIVFLPTETRAAFGDRISISEGQFKAGGDRIWINGANTPWHVWNDFGGDFDRAWWDHHFQSLHENGVNATRVWISCSGDIAIRIDKSGKVLGCTAKFWKDVDQLFEIAKRRQVYVMATLLSFDHFSSNNKSSVDSWRNMLASDTSIDSLMENYIGPFVERYRNNPWLWSVDLCNEPDWIHENPRCGQLPWDRLQVYFARAAVAVHARSEVLVTVGICMGAKYITNSAANIVSDKALQARAGGDEKARLDFYAPHHYDWMTRQYRNPFYMKPAAYGIDPSKPAVFGEFPARGTSGHKVTEDYEAAFHNGWQGAMGWTSNGVDGNGSLKQLGSATLQFRDKHLDLVFPGSPPGAPVGVP